MESSHSMHCLHTRQSIIANPGKALRTLMLCNQNPLHKLQWPTAIESGIPRCSDTEESLLHVCKKYMKNRRQTGMYLGLRPSWSLKYLLKVLRGVDLVWSWGLL